MHTGYASMMYYITISHPLGWLSLRAANFLHDFDWQRCANWARCTQAGILT